MNFWSLFGAVWNVQSYLGYTIINIEAHYWPNTELNSPDHISLKRPDLNLFFFSFFFDLYYASKEMTSNYEQANSRCEMEITANKEGNYYPKDFMVSIFES